MTDYTDTDMTADEADAFIASAVEQSTALLARIEKSRADQPERLAKARADADEARGWSMLEETWESQITAVPAYNSDGDRTGDALTIPNLVAKELFGSRLCFDLLDCGDDDEQINAVLSRYFSMVSGDPGLAFLLFSSALTTVASVVVPQLLEELEQQASDYDVRVMLAEARAKAWNGRVNDIRGGDK
jgi:hypothetical protein